MWVSSTLIAWVGIHRYYYVFHCSHSPDLTVGIYFQLSPVSSDMPPKFFEHFFTFWHNNLVPGSSCPPQGVLVHFTWKRYSKKQDLGPRFAYYYWDIIVLRPSWWAELGNRYVYIHICLSFYIFRTMSSYTSDSNPFLTFPRYL